MRILFSFILAAGLAMSLTTPVRAASDVAEVRTQLQVAMQRYIDRAMVDGSYVALDLTSGEMSRYHPTKAHSAIMAGDGFFVMCSELLTGDGTELEFDLYLTESSRGFKVFRADINNRGALKAMMAAGLVAEF